MSERLVIDTAEFARSHGELAGAVPLAQLDRLHDVLAETSGDIKYHLVGRRDGGRARLDLSLQGTLPLICQRCLSVLQMPLTLHHGFMLVAREEDLGELAEEPDDIDEIVASGAFDVWQLIEDELLLAVPFAPRHDVCDPASAAPTTPKESKFAGLAALRGKLDSGE